MHICFITNEFPKPGYPHGGVGTFIATLSKAMVAKGIQVSVVGKNNERENVEELDSGVKVYRLKTKKIKGLEWFLNTQAIAKKIKDIHLKTPIDVVETTELGLSFLPKLKGIYYVIRMNGGHHYFAKAEKRPTQWKHVYEEKKSFSKANAILAVSNFVKEETRQLVGLGDVAIEVIYNPIDVSKFHNTSSIEAIPYTIFFAGSLVEKKGIRQLIQALDFLVEDYPEIHLYIAGRDAVVPGTNTPYRPILESAITSKIKRHITFLGVVPNQDMPVRIAEAQICCYPSHMEAMPLAWLEVLSMGKIFIGSATGPGPEVVTHGKTGLLCNPHDPKAIAAQIKWVFQNLEAAKTIGKQAREDMLKRFDIDIIVGQNISFYNSIIS
jgi:glycosyltransferase involved in cell wall biosynthesis